MAYTSLDSTKPTVAQTRSAGVSSIQTNTKALRDIIAGMGMAQGFDYAQTGGTAEQPGNLWFKRGTEVVKVALTWGTTGGEDGNVTKAAFYFAANETHASYPSSTNGTYDGMADGSGEYVLTMTYDSSGNCTAATWGATP